MNPVRAYEYLTQARAKLFDWIRPLRQEQYRLLLLMYRRREEPL